MGRYPLLYQINTRVWLTDIARTLGRRATLDDIPDSALDRIAGQGFDWVWMLSVWQTGTAAQHISRTSPEWRREFEHTLPDLRIEDIEGSGFAITGYDTHRALGGDQALARLRERLRTRGLKLMLDFVPNHTAPDHPWVERHPEFYVRGKDRDLAREPNDLCVEELVDLVTGAARRQQQGDAPDHGCAQEQEDQQASLQAHAGTSAPRA